MYGIFYYLTIFKRVKSVKIVCHIISTQFNLKLNV